MEQETAVDYIFRKLDVLCRLTPQTRVTGTSEEWENLYKIAKAMEKEQIEKAFYDGQFYSVDYFIPDNAIEEGEQYYNETYNK
jgi:hypothetical protein